MPAAGAATVQCAMTISSSTGRTVLLVLCLVSCGGLAVVDGAAGAGGSATTTPTTSSTMATASGTGDCPAPPVQCNMPSPACPAGTFAAADPCPNGYCPKRCWTGECLPCAGECKVDSDCALVGKHGCCGAAGDCAKGCFWAASASQLSEPCYFAGVCPVPPAPPGCALDCQDDPACFACPHCGPNLARCEGGSCVSAWTSCEPSCACA